MASRPSNLRISIEHSGGKYWVYDHAFNEVKAGPFDTRADAKAVHAVIKSRARYTTSPRHHAELGFKTKYPGGQKRHNAGVGKAFTFHGSFTSKLAAKRKEAQTPGSFIQEKDGRYYLLKLRRIGSRSLNVRTNPKNAVKIYGRCLRIEAVKAVPHSYGGKASAAGQKYFHDFATKNAMIYGLPDGSLLIKAK